MDLEKALNRSEADRRSCSQKVEILEGQLQMVQNEFADTLKQLQELKDVLQKTQKVSDERQASVEKLTVQLRWEHGVMCSDEICFVYLSRENNLLFNI